MGCGNRKLRVKDYNLRDKGGGPVDFLDAVFLVGNPEATCKLATGESGRNGDVRDRSSQDDRLLRALLAISIELFLGNHAFTQA